MAKSRFIDVPDILSRGYAFNFVIGARGIGKTYGALKYCIDNDIMFVYMRRTEKEIDRISGKAGNPFKKLNYDLGISWEIKKGEDVKYINDEYGDLKGYAGSLSTLANLKGADFIDVKFIFYEEFIKPYNRPDMKMEATLFFDAYETFNRNRELEGMPPIQVFAAANSTNLNNPILAELELIPVIETMIRCKQSRYCDKERSLQIVLGRGYGISEEKRRTVLYQLTNKTNYGDMALSNEFFNDSFLWVEKCNLVEFKALFSWSGLYFYKHKSEPLIYVCWARHDGVAYNDEALYLVLRGGYSLKWTFMSGNMRFSDYTAKVKFLQMVSMA